MRDIFNKEYIKFVDKVDNWEEAIKLATQPLVEHKNVSENFAQKIIDATKEMGPYYILAKDLALGHVTPDGSVFKNGLSLLYLDQSINFKSKGDESGMVKFLFILSAVDGNSHLDLLRNLSKAFGNKEFYKEFYNLKNYEELNTLVEKYFG